MLEPKKPKFPLEYSTSQIVPRLKHKNFLTAVTGISPEPEDVPFTEPFVGDLIITYAYDTPEMFVMFPKRDLVERGFTVDQLRAKAVENLYKQLATIKTSGKPPVLSLNVGNDLEACLLLVDGLWNGFSKQIPGKTIVAVPTRSILLVTSSQSPEGLRIVTEIGREARQRERIHSLSEFLLVWDQNRWEVFDGGPAVGS